MNTSKTYLGYSESDLNDLSVYELREISRLLEVESGKIPFKYTHFFSKVDLLAFIKADKSTKEKIRIAKKAELDKKLKETANSANISKKESLLKSFNLRLKFYKERKNETEVKKIEKKIVDLKKEIADLSK